MSELQRDSEENVYMGGTQITQQSHIQNQQQKYVTGIPSQILRDAGTNLLDYNAFGPTQDIEALFNWSPAQSQVTTPAGAPSQQQQVLNTPFSAATHSLHHNTVPYQAPQGQVVGAGSLTQDNYYFSTDMCRPGQQYLPQAQVQNQQCQDGAAQTQTQCQQGQNSKGPMAGGETYHPPDPVPPPQIPDQLQSPTPEYTTTSTPVVAGTSCNPDPQPTRPTFMKDITTEDLDKLLEDFMNNDKSLGSQCGQTEVTFTIPEHKKNKKREKLTYKVSNR